MNKTIKAINEQVYEALKHLDVEVFELAEPILIRGEEEQILPCIKQADGECIHVLNEADRFDVTMYHKLNGKTFANQAAKGWGNKQGVTCIYDLSLVVFGKSSKSDMYALDDSLEGIIIGLKDTTLQSVNFNSVQVWGAEYTGIPYYLDPQFFMFKLNYRLSTTLLMGC